MPRPKKPQGVIGDPQNEVEEKILLRYDPEEGEKAAAVDGDLNYEFALCGPDGKPLKLISGYYVFNDRLYCWPHERDVREFKARGYRPEHYGEEGSVSPRGVLAEDREVGKPIQVRDHFLMSVPVDEWRRRKMAELWNGNRKLMQMRKEEESTLRLE